MLTKADANHQRAATAGCNHAARIVDRDHAQCISTVEIGYGMSSSSFEQEFWSADDENQVGDQDQYIVWTQTISQSASMFKLGLVTGLTLTSPTTSTWVRSAASVS